MAKKSSKKSGKKGEVSVETRICVLHGPEAMIKREHFEVLRGMMEKAYGEVETVTFDAETATLADIFDELRSFGLMQQYKLVVVDKADGFVKDNREVLERYAASPVDSATLVLRADRWYAGKVDKLIAKVGCVIKCEALKPAVATDWVVRRAKVTHERTIDKRAAQLLVNRIGCGDLMKLDTEIAKLALMVDKDQAIEVGLVEQLVAKGSEEQAWAVQEALLAAMAGRGSVVEKIHEIVDLSGQPDVLVAYFVADLVRKLHLAVMLKKQRVNDYQIASELKLWGERQQLFLQLLRRLDERKVTYLFDRVLRYDYRAKTGTGQALRNLECFCAELSGVI